MRLRSGREGCFATLHDWLSVLGRLCSIWRRIARAHRALPGGPWPVPLFWVLAGLGLSLGTFGMRSAAAGQIVGRAVVEVVDLPRTEELASLRFGSILKPAGGTNSVRISPSGGLTVLGDGDGRLAGGRAEPARYAISALPDQTILIRARPADTAGPGLILRGFTGSYNGGNPVGLDAGDGATFTAAAEAVLSLGAELTGLDSRTPPGTHTLIFTLDIAYQ